MINLSLIILSNNKGVSIEDGIEIILSNEANLVNNIKNAQGKYITFTKDSDMIDPKQFIDSSLDERWYPQKDYHQRYIGEVIAAYENK